MLWFTGWRCVRPAVFWGLFRKSGHWLVPMALGPLWDPESMSAASASINVSTYEIGLSHLPLSLHFSPAPLELLNLALGLDSLEAPESHRFLLRAAPNPVLSPQRS